MKVTLGYKCEFTEQITVSRFQDLEHKDLTRFINAGWILVNSDPELPFAKFSPGICEAMR